MKNAIEIPVSQELKEKYAQTLDLLDFQISRAYDPNRQYKIISVPRTMDFKIFSKVVSKDFGINEFQHMILDQLGNQVINSDTVAELYERYGSQLQVAVFHYNIQQIRE